MKNTTPGSNVKHKKRKVEVPFPFTDSSVESCHILGCKKNLLIQVNCTWFP
jgi:hypothetical protein